MNPLEELFNKQREELKENFKCPHLGVHCTRRCKFNSSNVEEHLSQCQAEWLKQTLEMIEREKVQDIFKDSMRRDYMSKTNRGWNNALTTLQAKLKGSNQ